MKQLNLWRSIVLAFTAMGFAGCSADSPTAPKFQSDPSAGLATDLRSGLLKMNVLERKTALTKDITVSAVIGDKGGRLSIPAAGFTVTIPAGAVKAPTKFSVTAIKGTMVAYEFGPHGIKFANSLIAQQDLNATKWDVLSVRPLVAGYFADRSALDLTNSTALLSEVLSGVIAPLSQRFSFKIDHFSGYVVAW